MRVADFIADFIFEELNVKHVFMVTGAGIMHLTDGVASHPKLQAICPHHEQTSSMAIDAYSRASENFGVGFFYVRTRWYKCSYWIMWCLARFSSMFIYFRSSEKKRNNK